MKSTNEFSKVNTFCATNTYGELHAPNHSRDAQLRRRKEPKPPTLKISIVKRSVDEHLSDLHTLMRRSVLLRGRK